MACVFLILAIILVFIFIVVQIPHVMNFIDVRRAAYSE